MNASQIGEHATTYINWFCARKPNTDSIEFFCIRYHIAAGEQPWGNRVTRQEFLTLRLDADGQGLPKWHAFDKGMPIKAAFNLPSDIARGGLWKVGDEGELEAQETFRAFMEATVPDGHHGFHEGEWSIEVPA